jgi:Tol biopolymer transport system component
VTDNSFSTNPEPVGEKPLESWKEIARHLNRAVRTVKRWEKTENLPARRHVHQSGSSVYAYPSELDAWRATRRPAGEKAEERPWLRPARWVAYAAAMLLTLGLAGDGLPLGIAAQGPDVVVRRVWSGAGVDISGTPSPDGRYLSLVDWETGDLAIREIASGEMRRVTNKESWFKSGEFASYSTIAPDGQQVAFAWFAQAGGAGDWLWELHVARLDSSSARTLIRNADIEYVQPAAWAPDGQHILAVFSRKDRSNQIVLVSAADGSVRVLRTRNGGFPRNLSFSRDGRQIAYSFPQQQGGGPQDIFLLAADGSREAPLVEHPADDFVLGWTPDSAGVLFASDRRGTTDAWFVPVADGKPQGAPQLVRTDLGRVSPLGFTPKGAFYYGVLTGTNDVYTATMDLAAGTLLSPPTPVSRRLVGSNLQPDWSPDGKQLVYISGRQVFPGGGKHGGILKIRDVETGEERELAPKLNGFFQPRWAVDGRSLFAWGNDREGRAGLFRIDARTGDATTIVLAGGIFDPTPSPDGKTIFYRRGAVPNAGLVSRNLATGQEKVIYTRSGAKGMALSPDGKWLAFRVPLENAVALMVMPATGGDTRELVRVAADNMPAITWTRDSRAVLYARPGRLEDKPVMELWLVPAEGGEARKLGLAMEGLRDLRVHPDGRRIVFGAGQPRAEVWVMENFLPAVKATR